MAAAVNSPGDPGLRPDPAGQRAALRLAPPAAHRAALNRLAGLAAELLGAPSAQISLLTWEQVVAAGSGGAADAVGTCSPLEESLCSVTARLRGPLVVIDAARDERVQALSPVRSGAVGSYLGVPLIAEGPLFVGALCVFGPEPHRWTDRDTAVLVRLAEAAMAELELIALADEFRAERDRWDAALEAAAIGVFDADLTTGSLQWDRRMQTLWGVGSDPTYATTLETAFDRVHPEDRPELEAAVRQAIERCGGYRREFRVVRPDGTMRWITGTGRAVADEHGRPVMLRGASQDITEVRTARDEAARLVETMATGFASFDRDWRFTYLNSTGAAIIGRPASELVGQVLWDVFPDLDDLKFGPEYRRAMDTRQIVDVVDYYPDLDAWFEVRSVPTADGLCQYFSDITRLYHDRQAALVAAENLQLLARVGELLVEADIDRALGNLAATLIPRLATWTVVAVRDEEGRFHDLARAHVDPAMGPTLEAFARRVLEAITDEATISVVVRTGTPRLVTDYAATRLEHTLSDEVVRGLARQLLPDSVLTVPIIGRHSTLGAIALVRTPGQEVWTPEEAEIAVEIGRRAGVALEHAQLARAQQRMSETLQNSLLSTPPQPDDLEIAVRYQAAARDAAVGGDWYDSFARRDGTTTLVVGDVTGHNRDAAAAMGQVRALLRGIAYSVPGSPATVLAALDEAIVGLDIGSLATCLLAQVETREEPSAGGRRLRWSSAGHLPPVLARPGQDPVLLQSPPDLLLGVDPAARRRDHTADLPDGALLLLYTDGLVERPHESLDRALERLAATVGELAHLALPALCDELLRRLAAGADDVALLAVRAATP